MLTSLVNVSTFTESYKPLMGLALKKKLSFFLNN